MSQNQRNKKAQESKQKPKEIKIIASTAPTTTKEHIKDKNIKAQGTLSNMSSYNHNEQRTSYNKDMEEMLHNYHHPDPDTHRIVNKDYSHQNSPKGAHPEYQGEQNVEPISK